MFLRFVSDIWNCTLYTVIVGNIYNQTVIKQIKSINKNKSFSYSA